jgi:acyl carrier protein
MPTMSGSRTAEGSLPELAPSNVVPLVIDALVEALGENDNSLLGITEDTWLSADLDLVSLQLVYLSVALEERFPPSLDPSRLFDRQGSPADVTVGDLARRIAVLLATPPAEEPRA